MLVFEYTHIWECAEQGICIGRWFIVLEVSNINCILYAISSFSKKYQLYSQYCYWYYWVSIVLVPQNLILYMRYISVSAVIWNLALRCFLERPLLDDCIIFSRKLLWLVVSLFFPFIYESSDEVLLVFIWKIGDQFLFFRVLFIE